MITATSTVKSVSQGTANTRPKPVWHPQCATQIGLSAQVRDWNRSATPSARPKWVCYPSARLTSV